MATLHQDNTDLASRIEKAKRQTPDSKALSDQIHSHFFSVHRYTAEKNCFEKLRNLAESISHALDDWCRQQRDHFSEARTGVRNSYLEHLREFLLDYADIRRFLKNRTDTLRGHISNLKHSQEEAQELLGPNSVHNNDS